jgi:hypothetical protein
MKTVIPFLWKKEVKGCAGAISHEYAGRLVRRFECLVAPALLWLFKLLVNTVPLEQGDIFRAAGSSELLADYG